MSKKITVTSTTNKPEIEVYWHFLKALALLGVGVLGIVMFVQALQNGTASNALPIISGLSGLGCLAFAAIPLFTGILNAKMKYGRSNAGDFQQRPVLKGGWESVEKPSGLN